MSTRGRLSLRLSPTTLLHPPPPLLLLPACLPAGLPAPHMSLGGRQHVVNGTIVSQCPAIIIAMWPDEATPPPSTPLSNARRAPAASSRLLTHWMRLLVPLATVASTQLSSLLLPTHVVFFPLFTPPCRFVRVQSLPSRHKSGGWGSGGGGGS